jgi:hypothetical protein
MRYAVTCGKDLKDTRKNASIRIALSGQNFEPGTF